MMNEHTPGPWNVTTFPTMATPIVCAGPLTIAWLVAMPVPGGHTINGEVWANARLIASAPELLAALNRIVESDGTPWVDLIKDARAAISKATGQALQDLADIGQELNI